MCYHCGVAERIVIDTNVLVSTVLSPQSPNRELLRRCFEGNYQPLIGHKLFLEYEDVFSRPDLMQKSPFSPQQRERLLNNILSICLLVPVYYLWRPNSPDEGDNHLLELAVAGNASSIVTYNVRDLKRAELHFPVSIRTPADLLKGDPS